MPGRSHSKKAHKETSTSSQGELLTSEPPSSSQRWQSIRPWRPPEGLSADESEITRLQVEVIDVSSTAVALAFLASDQQPNSQTANTSALPSGSSRSPEQTHSNPNKTTSLAVKLNNQPWPHVLHSDPAFFQDIEDATTSQGQSSPTASGATTIVIYGLRPGTCYAVQLEWQSQPEAGPSSLYSLALEVIVMTRHGRCPGCR